MTDSSSSLMAILFGLGVFAVIVAIGWRSVQDRRILRLQGANGQETIIVAREDDKITSVVKTATDVIEPAEAAELDGNTIASQAVVSSEADAVGRDRLRRVVANNE